MKTPTIILAAAALLVAPTAFAGSDGTDTTARTGEQTEQRRQASRNQEYKGFFETLFEWRVEGPRSGRDGVGNIPRTVPDGR